MTTAEAFDLAITARWVAFAEREGRYPVRYKGDMTEAQRAAAIAGIEASRMAALQDEDAFLKFAAEKIFHLRYFDSIRMADLLGGFLLGGRKPEKRFAKILAAANPILYTRSGASNYRELAGHRRRGKLISQPRAFRGTPSIPSVWDVQRARGKPISSLEALDEEHAARHADEGGDAGDLNSIVDIDSLTFEAEAVTADDVDWHRVCSELRAGGNRDQRLAEIIDAVFLDRIPPTNLPPADYRFLRREFGADPAHRGEPTRLRWLVREHTETGRTISAPEPTMAKPRKTDPLRWQPNPKKAKRPGRGSRSSFHTIWIAPTEK